MLTDAEDLIARLSGGLHPADRAAFRREAEAAVNVPGQCSGDGLIHRSSARSGATTSSRQRRPRTIAPDPGSPPGNTAGVRQASSSPSLPARTTAAPSDASGEPWDAASRTGPTARARTIGAASIADLLPHERAAVEIPDPYGTPSDAQAKLEPGLRRDGTQAAGEREWRAPEAPLMAASGAAGVKLQHVPYKRTYQGVSSPVENIFRSIC